METKTYRLFVLLTGNINIIVSRLILMSLVFLVLSYFLGTYTFTKGFVLSLGMAYVDVWIFFFGIKRALTLRRNPRRGLMAFHKYTFIRIINISVMFYALSKVISLKDYASGLCMGFLLIHILLILYLIFVTHRQETGA